MRIMLPLALAGMAALGGCVGYGGATYGAGYGSPYYDTPYSPYYSPYYGYGGSVVIEQRYSYPYGTSGATRRDRDGDGVPNRRDAYPDNPRRY